MGPQVAFPAGAGNGAPKRGVAEGERGLWQRRYWEHMIRDAEDWRRHAEYCWINPVKHALVGAVRDWRRPSIATSGAGWCRAIGPETWWRGVFGE